MKKAFLLISSAIFYFVLSAQPVFAIADPPLFSCVQPVGTITSSYDSGTHGIPGDARVYTGSDTVYAIDESHVLQCFCPEDGNTGIQSNWWKVGGLTKDELDFFQRRGWIFVSNGSAWGLDEAPYLVMNEKFSCGGRGGGSSDDDDDKKSSSGSSSSSSGGTGGSVVTTLAATGNTPQVILYLVVAVTTGGIAYRLSRE